MGGSDNSSAFEKSLLTIRLQPDTAHRLAAEALTLRPCVPAAVWRTTEPIIRPSCTSMHTQKRKSMDPKGAV